MRKTFQEIIEDSSLYDYLQNYIKDEDSQPIRTFISGLIRQVRFATLQEAANNADADYTIIGSDIEVYVLTNSILELDKNSIEI